MNEKVRNFWAVFFIAAIFLFSFVANVKVVEGIPLCLFKAVTNLGCPGCGLLRSFVSISHGEFLKAVSYNLLGPVAYVLLFLYWMKNLSELLGKRLFPTFFIMKKESLSSKILFFLFMGQWSYKFLRQVYSLWF